MVDENTFKHCYTKIKKLLPKHTVIRIKSGEENKTLSTCELVWKKLTNENAEFNGLVIEDFCISASNKYLFIRNNLYSQVDLHSAPKNLGQTFENLFNIHLAKNMIRCFRLDKIANYGIFEEIKLQLSNDNLFDGKMCFYENDDNNELNGNIVFIKPYRVESIKVDFTQSFPFLPISPIKLKGLFLEGISLDFHTISSKINSDGSFDTQRTKLGEHLYRLKYCFQKEDIFLISDLVSRFLLNFFSKLALGVSRIEKFDIILPIPPSNHNRPFQPVFELAKKISELSGIATDLNYLIKQSTPALKGIDDNETRKEFLKNAFSIVDTRFKGKNVLLFDDLYRSGETLNAATQVLKEQGEVANVYVLTITKTRTKR